MDFVRVVLTGIYASIASVVASLVLQGRFSIFALLLAGVLFMAALAMNGDRRKLLRYVGLFVGVVLSLALALPVMSMVESRFQDGLTYGFIGLGMIGVMSVVCLLAGKGKSIEN